ncbi:hypothetical protein ACFZAT_26095 [Streptomyces sp. NPDC008163]|uniref:hypothetical protein n=1 Tax=Streptomyces sp. NPDC008163 TaxID=3364818 RepID=UPI0036F165CC
MDTQRDPTQGLARYNLVDAAYFDDSDRDGAVGAGVRLVNVLRRFGVDLDSISAERVCHNCTPNIRDSYRLELGSLSIAETNEKAAQLEDFAAEFERMHELLNSPSAD